jgi:flagellar protein FliO/FliZ
MPHKIVSIILLSCIFFFTAHAQEVKPANPPTKASQVAPQAPTDEKALDHYLEKENIGRPSIVHNTNYWSEFINMLFVLGGIIVVLLLAGWLLKRVLRSRIAQVNFSSSIKIIDKRALHPKACLYLIEVEGKRFVVGEGQNHMALVTELPEKESTETEGTEKPAKSFKTLFKSHLSKKSEI